MAIGADVRVLLTCAAILSISAVPAWGQSERGPRFALDRREVQDVHAVLSYRVHCDRVTASEWILFFPVPPELPSQSQVRISMKPNAETIEAAGPSPRPLLRIRVPAENAQNQHDLSIEVTINARLNSRRLIPVAPGRPHSRADGLPADERELYLKDRGNLNIKDPGFVKWMAEQKLIKKKAESDLDFARRVFVLIRKGFTYEYAETMDRRTSAVCRLGKSDCGGLSHLFIGILRANQVPARCLYGRWAESSKPGAKLSGISYHQIHAKSEFFAEGIGWVPVDPATGIGDKSVEAMQFFGSDPGNFVTLHVEDGFEVDTIHFGKNSLDYMQTPKWWVSGSGKLENVEITESWQVTSMKLPTPR
jgi:hypothetical protein